VSEVVCINPRCNAVFVQKRRGARQKFCSFPCRNRFYALKNSRKIFYPLPTEKIKCIMCPTVFLPKRKSQDCCSKRCWDRKKYKENPQKHRDKMKRLRRKQLAYCRRRDRLTWAQMRDERGKESKYVKSRYPWIALLTGARHRAKTFKRTFNLTRNWCAAKWTGRCEVTDIEFILNASVRHPFSPSLDRIDNSKGYEPDNCRFVLWAVNQFKHVSTDADMLKIAKAIVEHHSTKYAGLVLSLPG